MEKVIRDGKVGVLYSPGHGAGWYSWHDVEELIYDPSIVGWVEQGQLNKIQVSPCLYGWSRRFSGSMDTSGC
jgi:hypothetical protein